MLLLLQVEAVIDGTTKLTDGRGDSFVFGLCGLGLAGALIYLFARYLNGQAERHSTREKEERERQEKREADDKARQDRQEEFWRERATEQSKQMEKQGTTLERMARVTELAAEHIEKTDNSLLAIHQHQARDRRAIAYALDAVDATHRQEHEQANQAIRDARRELINDRD